MKMLGKEETKRITLRLLSDAGAVLFLTLGIMVILLSLGLMFAAVSISRQAITNNQADAIKARAIAESGIADALSRLRTNPSSASDIGVTDFAGGTYSVDLYRLSDTEVELTATGEYGRGKYRTRVVVELPPPEDCIYAWALREGESVGDWSDSLNAHDDARGPNDIYASVPIDGITSRHGLAGFRVESMPYPITKVELVMRYYLPQALKGGDLDMRWNNDSADKGPWLLVSGTRLNAALGTGGFGFVAMDTTSHPPPGGWTWDLFAMDTGFQVDVRTKTLNAFDPGDPFHIDCVGFRISWGGYDPPDPVGWGAVIEDGQ